MRVLVTGVSGQLGSTIAQLLQGRHEVIGLDPAPSPGRTHEGGVEDRKLVSELMKGVDAVMHVASLHAPHVPKTSKARFVNINVHGTLNLLETAVAAGVQRFIYTSTTSVYGEALSAPNRAVWIDEEVTPRPRDIYDVTKHAAEELCRVVHLETNLPVIILRASRYFPQPPNVTAVHRLYRGADVRDVAEAHLLALERVELPWGIYNISARSPFQPEDVWELQSNAPTVIRRRCPDLIEEFAARGWELPQSIDRVYAIGRADRELGYAPRFNYQEYLKSL